MLKGFSYMSLSFQNSLRSSANHSFILNTPHEVGFVKYLFIFVRYGLFFHLNAAKIFPNKLFETCTG